MNVKPSWMWTCIVIASAGCGSSAESSGSTAVGGGGSGGDTTSATASAGDGGTGQGTQGEGGESCAAGLVECDGACVDTIANVANCGACGAACGADQVCTGGVCEDVCGGVTVKCGDACVDPSADMANCGACGVACLPGQEACDGGACMPIVCVPGETKVCYSGAPETLVGACKPGVSTCNALGTALGACVGEVLPSPEKCGDSIDDDCDGQIANGCVFSSCAKLPAGAPSGIYSIDPDGAGPGTPFEAYCEMGVDGGGWTLIATVANNEYFKDTNCYTGCGDYTPIICDETPFSSASPHGDIDKRLTSDYKSKAYSTVPFKEILFQDSAGHHASYVVSAVALKSVFDWYPVGLQNYVAGGVKVHPTYSFSVNATDMDAQFNPCGTLQLSFNVEDSDTPPGAACHSSAKGPVWAAVNNNDCFWDDAGIPWTIGSFSGTNVTTYRLWLVR